MDEQTMPTLEELRGVIAHRKYVYDSHLMDMPVNWENIAAMVSGIADAQNEYIDTLEADHAAQQQRIEALEAALKKIMNDPDGARYDENGKPGEIAPDDDWAHGHLTGLKDAARIAYDALHADAGEKGEGG